MPETRRCEVIGLDVGDADTDTSLTAFGLGVVGVLLAISDADQGLNAAVMALAVIASFDHRSSIRRGEPVRLRAAARPG